ncbi:MAG: tyrosine-type recombinase/integrase [Bacillota bacterium]
MPTKKKMADKVDKRLRAKITVGTGIDGKPIIKYASGRSKKELETSEKELRKTYIGGQEVQRDALFETYAANWVKTYKEGKKSVGTDENYHTALHHHLVPAFKNRQLRAITSFDLQNLLNGKAGMSRTTIGYILTVLRGVFGKATAEGVIDRNPTLGIVKPDTASTSRRALTDNESAATLKVGAEHPDGLLLLVLYYTGLRRGEAIGLQWRDVDFQARTLSVRRDFDFKTEDIGKLKTKAAHRMIPIPDELYSALDSVRGIGETFVFQRIIRASKTRLEAYRDTWNDLRSAMLAVEPKIESANGGSILTAHYYRHNYASILYNAGIDVLTAQKWLGHADARTTLSIYAHLSEDFELENADKLKDAFSKKVAKRLPESQN